MRYLIGIGTYQALDDSIGLRIAETIAEKNLDEGFSAIDLGGNLLDLVHYLGEGTERVLVVDSALMGMEPGEFAFFSAGDVTSGKRLEGFSTHEDDLLKVLEFASAMGGPIAPVTIMGIQPAEIRAEFGLSPVLEARFDDYIAAARAFFAE